MSVAIPEQGQTEPLANSARRIPGPRPMTGSIEPDAPPEAPDIPKQPLFRILMPVVMAVAVIGMVALMLVSGMSRNPMTFLFPLMMVISMVGMVTGGATGSTDMSKVRRDFQRHLSSIRRAITRATIKQREVAFYEHPHPEDLWQVVRNGRSAERRFQDPDFLTLRIGLGTQRPLTPVIPPQIPAPKSSTPCPQWRCGKSSQ